MLVLAQKRLTVCSRRDMLVVPLGVIESAYGGTTIEQWSQ